MITATTEKPTPQSKKRKKTATTKKKKPTQKLMSSPAKESKTTATTMKNPKLTPQSSPIPSLPYDLVLNCLARLSRLYYLTLSLVSKSFRSLLASPVLYKVRSLLGRTESCLYVCLDNYSGSRWFTLCWKPDEMLTNDDTSNKKKSTGYVLAPVPIQDPNRGEVDIPSFVVVGSNIYTIGPPRSLARRRSSPIPVFVLDCGSHTWHEAPCLPVKLASLSASVLDQKIYVAGCCDDGDLVHLDSYKNYIEVFDTKTQTWDPNPIPCSDTKGDLYDKTACFDGKFHVVHMKNDEMFAYDTKEGRWDLVGERMGSYMDPDSYCEIQNTLYSLKSREITWYDTEVSKWTKLKGLVGLPKLPPDKSEIRMADYGGKMAVLWHEQPPYWYCRKEFWCAEITLEKRRSGEIWGKVEWFDRVLTISTFDTLTVLAATV